MEDLEIKLAREKEAKREKINDNGNRTHGGIVASVIGLCCNILLAASKLVVGLLFGSMAILADGVNNATDSASSLVSLVSFKLSSRPADKEHPFGHQRLEYIATLIIAFIIFFVAFELIKSSIETIVSGAMLEVTIAMFIVSAVSIVVKAGMGAYYLAVAKKIKSSALKASAVDSFSDVIATTAVLISSIIIWTTGVNVDAYFGIAVALFVLWSGVKIIKEAISPLLGEQPNEEMVKRIDDKIRSYEMVLGLHNLIVHSYGPNKFFASVHVEVDGAMSTNKSHALADKIEHDMRDEGINLVVHIDPHKLYENTNRAEREENTRV